MGWGRGECPDFSHVNAPETLPLGDPVDAGVMWCLCGPSKLGWFGQKLQIY